MYKSPFCPKSIYKKLSCNYWSSPRCLKFLDFPFSVLLFLKTGATPSATTPRQVTVFSLNTTLGSPPPSASEVDTYSFSVLGSSKSTSSWDSTSCLISCHSPYGFDFLKVLDFSSFETNGFCFWILFSFCVSGSLPPSLFLFF